MIWYGMNGRTTRWGGEVGFVKGDRVRNERLFSFLGNPEAECLRNKERKEGRKKERKDKGAGCMYEGRRNSGGR